VSDPPVITNSVQEHRAETTASSVFAGPDPELEQLPSPRRPWRRTTIFSLLSCFAVSVTLLMGLLGDFAFSTRRGPPRELGNLASLRPTSGQVNQWIRAEGELADHGGIRYQRPLEADSFRLVPIEGNDQIWVQVRVPAGFEDEHFVPPTAFVGRLLKASSSGIRYSALRQAVRDAGWPASQMPNEACILVDGESPAAIRWVLALAVILLGSAGFSLWATSSVLRPARSA
jgi:hypothetical protein